MIVMRKNKPIEISTTADLKVDDLLYFDTYEQMIQVIQKLSYSCIQYAQKNPLVLTILETDRYNGTSYNL